MGSLKTSICGCWQLQKPSKESHEITSTAACSFQILQKMEGKIRPATIIPNSPSEPPLLLLPIVRLHAHKLFLLIFLLSSPLLLPRPLAAEMESFHYLDFKDSTGICFQGNATAKGTGAIQLNVKDLDGSMGLAYYCEPIYLWDPTTNQIANFTTTFTFGVSSIRGNTRGGGVTFFLSGDPTIPQGGRGDYLGLEDGRNDVVSDSGRFIAVEFDSRPNNWDPADSPCHMGIDINSLESVAIAKMWDDIFVPGPQGKAQVAYNSISKTLIASLDYNQTLYRLSYKVDLSSQLPQQVYVGFSLATDKSQDPKNITSWSFRYSNLGAETPPSPSRPPRSPSSPFAVRDKPNNSSDNSEGPSSKKNAGVLVAAIVLPLLFVLVTAIVCFFLCKSKTTNDYDDGTGGLPLYPNQVASVHPPHPVVPLHPRHIPFKQLAAATDNFHESRRLGKGAFGGVYHGFLKDLNQEVAIKKIEEYSAHGEKEFAAEVKTISRSQHRHLVKLIGYCHEGHELLLVYEFMPNGSLDRHLFNNGDKVISWSKRYDIAHQLASVLQYLHEGLDECIMHRDIKPNNILLDSEFNVKLGDFGLARAANHGSALQSTMVAGTMGYMPPEYFSKGTITKEADNYGFGIVALELVSGRRAIEPREIGRETLLQWIYELYEKGMIMGAIDKKLGTMFDRREVTQLVMVGLWSAHPEANRRASFRQVISALDFEIEVPDLNINPSSIAQLPYMMASGMSSSTLSSNHSQAAISMGSLR